MSERGSSDHMYGLGRRDTSWQTPPVANTLWLVNIQYALVSVGTIGLDSIASGGEIIIVK